MTLTRGKVHNYFGMKIDFSNPGKAMIDMTEYIDKMLLDLPLEFDGKTVTPAANYLFNVDN
eukprot:3053800-Ditylum_brightwellii.AAC.1